MHWNGWWFMGWMPLLWIVFIVVVLVFLFRQLRPSDAAGPWPASGETAEEILKGRYARGDIDKEEFEEKLEDLRR